MMRRVVCAVAAILIAEAAFADMSALGAMCVLIVRDAPTGALRQVSDKQVEKGLCNTTKGVMEAVTLNNDAQQSVCLSAGQYLMAEFKRRFPARDPKTVIGRC
jgi:hypothetical protein